MIPPSRQVAFSAGEPDDFDAMAARHPNVAWVLYWRSPLGALHARCEVCGAEAGPLMPAGVDQFAAAHRQHTSAAPTHYGAGDLVARATKAMGITPCTPCEKRRMMLNQFAPRVWRR